MAAVSQTPRNGTGQRKNTGGRTTGGTKRNTKGSGGQPRKKGAAGQKSGSGRRRAANKNVPMLQQGSIWSRYQDEILLVITLAVSILLLLANFHLCGPAGEFISQAVFGLFGFLAYALPFLLFFGVAFSLSNKGNRSVSHKLVCTCLLFFIMAALLQMVSYGNSAKMPVPDLYRLSAEGKDGGGLIGGGIAKLLCMAVDVAGTYIILLAVMILLMMFITEKLFFASLGRKYRQQRQARAERKAERMELREAYAAEDGRDESEWDEEEAGEDPDPGEAGRGWKWGRKERIGKEPEDSFNGTEEEWEKRVRSRAEKKQSERRDGQKGRKKGRAPRSYTFPAGEEGTPESVDMREITLKNLVIHRGENPDPEESGGFAEEDFRPDMSGMFEDDPSLDQAPFYEEELKNKFGTGGEEGAEEQEAEVIPFRVAEPVLRTAETGRKTPEETDGFSAGGSLPDGETEEEPTVETIAARPRDSEAGPDFGRDVLLDPAEEEKARILAAKSIEGGKPLDSYTKTPPVPEAGFGYGAKTNEAGPEGRKAGEAPGAFGGEGMENGKTGAAGAKTGAAGSADRPAPSAGKGAAGGSGTAEQLAAKPAVDSGAPGIPMIRPVDRPYSFPPVDLLNRPKGKPKGSTDEELAETALTLQKTLESFGVRVAVTNVSCGPAVTRFELQPERGVKVSRITGLADDIKLNLAAADIRIEAPIPGKAAVGIEVPNKENSMVYLRELIDNKAFRDHKSKIAFAVGKDIGGQTVVTDIAKMPHLLIAGATGSGKSVCINTLIMSILYKSNPNDVKLIMIDPKVVELSVYNGIPHLLIPVVTDPKKASGALNWAVMEMMDRYQRFAEIGVRDMKGYNEKIASTAGYKEDPRYVKMPQIVIIVDELADLMMVAPGEVEDSICRLAQLARAAGIHLIIATQRPSVNVITGLIKANIPSRIAFAVSSSIDSRTILDGSGAEKLLGKGDMLFFPTGYPKPVRVQGAFVSDQEVTAVVDYLSKQNEGSVYNAEIAEKISNAQPAQAGGTADAPGANNGQDEYFAEAGKFIIEKDKASIGMLQRVYKIGFNRAARIMDQLSEAGVVGPEEGTKPRKVLMSPEEFENYLEQH